VSYQMSSLQARCTIYAACSTVTPGRGDQVTLAAFIGVRLIPSHISA
jgi:hypothetical protein